MIKTMRDAVLSAGGVYGQRVAIRFGESERSYRELVGRACRLANTFEGLGLIRGDRVAVLVDDRLESIEPYLACAIGGFVAVTVNRRLADPEISVILADSAPRAMVHTDGLSPVVDQLGLSSDMNVLTIGSGDRPAGSRSYETELSRASRTMPTTEVRTSDPFMIGYTSGTTGVPKGAVLIHERQLMASLMSCANLGIRPYDELAFSASFSYPGAVTGHLLPTLLTGGGIRILGKVDFDDWFYRMAHDRTTITYIASPLMPQFLDFGRKNPDIVGHLTTALHGGGPAPRHLMLEMVDMFGQRFVETWGMTESGGTSVAITASGDRVGGARQTTP